LKESNFQLIGKPRITNLQYSTNKDFVFGNDLKLQINNQIQVIHGEDEDQHEALEVLNLGVFRTAEFKDVPFVINLEIEGLFKWDEHLEKKKDMLEIMLKQNAPAILYGYLRPIITFVTVEANMPPLVIPLMNFNEN